MPFLNTPTAAFKEITLQAYKCYRNTVDEENDKNQRLYSNDTIGKKNIRIKTKEMNEIRTVTAHDNYHNSKNNNTRNKNEIVHNFHFKRRMGE